MSQQRQLCRSVWPKAVATGLTAMLLAGCATYQPKPITEAAVQEATRSPGPADLSIHAEQINHPILRPVDLDLKNGLRPDSAAVLAVLLNPSLRAVRDRRELADAQLLQAKLLPDPQLSLGVDIPVGGGTGGSTTAYNLGLDWDVSALLTRRARIDVAQTAAQRVDLDVAWQEWRVAQAAKASVYRLVGLAARTALAQQASQDAMQDQGLFAAAVRRGAMTTAALDAARVVTSQAKEDLLELDRQTTHQRLLLDRLLGRPGNTEIRLDQHTRLPEHIDVPDAATLTRDLEHRRLDLLALHRGYDSQDAAVRLAVLKQFPRVTFGPTAGRDTDRVRTAGVSVGLSLPIFDRNQGGIARERATRQKLFDEYVARLLSARSEVEQLVADIRAANQQIAAAKATEQQLAKLVEQYRAALAQGRVTVPTYHAARANLLRTRLKLLGFRERLVQASIGLELATGLYELPKPAPPNKDKAP